MNERFVTISIDDGHPSDLHTRDLLREYGLRATFYIPARNAERPTLPASHVRELGEEFEIGAHTFNHVPLTRLPAAAAWREINDSKSWLQDLLGRPVDSFCYPRGKFTSRIAGMVEKAGFLGARTCLFNLNDFPADPFRWGVSTHASSHSRFIQIRHGLLERNFVGLWQYFATFKAETNWLLHFQYALNAVESGGGIAHLYLHSWEIEKLQQWTELERVFRYISQRPTLTTVTNGDLYRMWNPRRHIATVTPAEEAQRGS